MKPPGPEISDIDVAWVGNNCFRVHWRSGQDRFHIDTYVTGKPIRLAIWKNTVGVGAGDWLTPREVKAYVPTVTALLASVVDHDLIAKCTVAYFERTQQENAKVQRDGRAMQLRKELLAEAERLYLAGAFADRPQFAKLREIGRDLDKC